MFLRVTRRSESDHPVWCDWSLNGAGRAKPGTNQLLPCSCSCAEGQWATGQALAQLSQDTLQAGEQVGGHTVLLGAGQSIQVTCCLQQLIHLLYDVLEG